MRLRPLTLGCISLHVDAFIQHAKDHPDITFFVTAVGTGLAGYGHEEIAPLFKGAPASQLPDGWAGIIAKAEAAR